MFDDSYVHRWRCRVSPAGWVFMLPRAVNMIFPSPTGSSPMDCGSVGSPLTPESAGPGE